MKNDVSGMSAVFYVDGSCRPHNPGYIGWGIHGYYYSNPTDKAVVAEQYVHTADGYKSALAVDPTRDKYVIPTYYLDGFGSHDGLMTNNVAEIKGLCAILEQIQDEGLKTVKIFTDSMYLKDSINDWCRKWEKNNWIKQDGSPVSNREIIEKTYRLFLAVKEKGTKLSLEWIRSHTGHLGNERADVLAGIGMSYSQQGTYLQSIETFPYKGFWKSDPNKSPYLAFRRLYFNSMAEYNQPGVYYMAESPDTEFVIGKPSSSVGYSVIYLNEPDETIENIRKKQFEWSKNINVLILMKLESVFSKQVFPWLDKYGSVPIMGNVKTHSMSMVDKRPITLEMNPTGLSLRAFDHFAILEEILQGYIKNKDSHPLVSDIRIGAWPIQVIDITHHFFKETVDKKGKIKYELLPEFVVGYRDMSMTINIEHNGNPLPVKIPYLLGYDCLPRNNLKYLETTRPKISLLVWKENSILRYVTIIDSAIGVGIWSNFFANHILLPASLMK